MRPFFTTPLAALSAAYLTWMVMEKQPGAGPEPDVHLPGELAPSLPAATCDMQTEQPEKRDEFQELVLSGRRSWAILQDLGCFALYSTAEKIWPWPLDFNGTELVQDQLAHLPLQELREAAEAARHGVSELLAPLAEAAAPLLQELRQTSGKAFHDFMETFLEAYPQHRASLKGVHPGLLVGAAILLLADVFMVWQLCFISCRFCLDAADAAVASLAKAAEGEPWPGQGSASRG
eukprot:CAMPEP_0181453770 /NCGR_PEP_ID=MMETSP1110-20121109/29895_1 /TAXON_ID=174948 /ORGANISM="Symbiodinium sp., Strain CCMP421" /LENGTH=233 /DNA_ID=CAMNT_0023578097 /DNA_START=49 /DNA_END=747 /DNA_ORIENTATION=-